MLTGPLCSLNKILSHEMSPFMLTLIKKRRKCVCSDTASTAFHTTSVPHWRRFCHINCFVFQEVLFLTVIDFQLSVRQRNKVVCHWSISSPCGTLRNLQWFSWFEYVSPIARGAGQVTWGLGSKVQQPNCCPLKLSIPNFQFVQL